MTRRMVFCTVAVAAFLVCCTTTLSATMLITEFMALNNTTIKDEDGQYSDWIEIHNAGATAVDLDGWHLTDNAADLRKWKFPATNCPAGAYMLVFASDKNRRRTGNELHTNFKLSGDGEYLALVMPDGSNVAFAYAPAFPPQVADVSYGLAGTGGSVTLVTSGVPCYARIPINDALGRSWTSNLPISQVGWLSGTTGVGYERSSGCTAPGYLDTGLGYAAGSVA